MVSHFVTVIEYQLTGRNGNERVEFMGLLILLMGATGLNTCADYKAAGPTHRAHYLDGIQSGYLSGQFLYFRTIIKHELAGDNSEHLARVLDRIVDDTYKLYKVEDVDREMSRFCKLDEGGKFPLYLVYLTVVRRMSGGSEEEFMTDVKALYFITYGDGATEKGKDI